MGAGASAIPPDLQRVDKAAALEILGDRFDAAAFDAAAQNGSVGRLEFLEASERHIERQLIVALSMARQNPSQTARRIEQRLNHFKGKDYFPPERGGKVAVATKEGQAAVREAVGFLDGTEAIPELCEPEDTTTLLAFRLAAEDHLLDRGTLGVIGHEGADGSYVSDRTNRYGTWTKACGECLWFGRQGASAESIVDDLIVDDNVKGRGHRMCIFDDRYKVSACRLGPHKVFGMMASIAFAAEYAGDSAKVAARTSAGPPKVSPSAAAAAAGGASSATQWSKSLGDCVGCRKPILGGSVMEIASLGKFHKACFACAECGKALVGVPFKAEKGQPRCNECHVKLFTPDCASCGAKITGRGLQIGGKKYHAECKPASSPPVTSGPKRSAKPAKSTTVPGMAGAKTKLDGIMGDYASL
mmetsp:Transcript_11351/g.29022  ORF Transcript_11351/g.29022 Transcript_11351/m.29022 type:complete len:415 (-) Transcript_11351:175-1419(-)